MVSADDIFTGIGFAILIILIFGFMGLYAYSYYVVATDRKKELRREKQMLLAR